MIWSYRKGNQRAEIAIVNDRYRWEIWELWLDRHGKLEHPGKILAMGWDLTLEQAKKSALAVLEPQL